MTGKFKRAKKHETATAVIRTWGLGDFQVSEVRSKLGLSTYYLVIEKLSNGNEVVRSQHRKEGAAKAKALKLERAEA